MVQKADADRAKAAEVKEDADTANEERGPEVASPAGCSGLARLQRQKLRKFAAARRQSKHGTPEALSEQLRILAGRFGR